MQTEVAPPACPIPDIEIKLDARKSELLLRRFPALQNASLSVPGAQDHGPDRPLRLWQDDFLRVFNRMYDLVPGTRATGEVLIDGHNVLSPDTDVINLRGRSGMLFQRANPLPKSIFDNVVLRPPHARWSKQRINEVVEESSRTPGCGTRSRIVATLRPQPVRAVSNKRFVPGTRARGQAEVVLMDEPASALDPIATLRIEETHARTQGAVYDR